MTIRYGVISDVHKKPEKVKNALSYLKGIDVDKLLVVGDVGESAQTITHERAFTGNILEMIAKSGLTAYVCPGSHETLFGYGNAVNWFANEYPNQIVDVSRKGKIRNKSHDLVFLPGSDFTCGGEYQLTDEEETGTYVVTSGENIKNDNLDYAAFNEFKNKNPDKNVLEVTSFFNMNDLKKLVTRPDKTIVVCHVPRKFDLEGCVDMGHFYSNRKYKRSSIIGADGQWVFEEKGITPGTYNGDDLKLSGISCFGLDTSEDEIKSKLDELEGKGFIPELYLEQMGNRGNEKLRKLYEELGITKVISGHFHESVHNVHDLNGKPIVEGKFTKELFWMASHLDEGKFGILNARATTVSYENVTL